MTITATSDNQILKSNIRNWAIRLQTFATGSLPRSGLVQRDLWNIASVRLDTGELHHLGPLFGFLCDQLAELRRRSRQRHAAEVGETGLHLGVGESRIGLFVELVDDLCGRVRGNAKAVPLTRLLARE